MKNGVERIWQPIDFTIYFSFIKWMALLLLTVEIAFRLWVGGLGGGPLYEHIETIAWIIRIAIFIWLGFRVSKNFGSSAAIAAISGVLIGFINGLVIAIFRFGGGIRVWKFFNIITETTLAIVVGSLATILVVYIFSFKKINN